MARPLQVLSLLSRLGARPLTPSNRFSSRGVAPWIGQSHVRRGRAAGHSQDMSEEEGGGHPEDVGDVEDKLQTLMDEGRKRQRTVKYHILRRQMTPPGAPQRKLTWEAIEQIRYLKQEQPEEWTVERLAEGFSVTPDVILRVLRNKFVPAPERKAKQDTKVMAALSQPVLPSGAGQDRLKLPGNKAVAILTSGSREGALISAADQMMISGALAKSPAPVTVLPTRLPAGIRKDAIETSSTEEDWPSSTNPTEEDTEEEESWDGWVLTDNQLEEFMEMEKPSPVVQVGNDFFDAEGNFMYRI
ncbi:neugrin [Hippoglossus hippoglossus]|uniref:neugrin n=1 Tax=Hippoglossus hippoglossus TaxID=8267 RepID=UPI00148D071A|nr:neugrin [Hippoglossus hippoglossus]